MRIFNEDKTIELTKVDKEKGYLKSDKLVIAHHEATPFKKGRTAQEIARELEAQGVVIEESFLGLFRVVEEDNNGGRVTEEIKDESDIPAAEAWDEYEDIQVFVPYAESELQEIADKKHYAELKKELEKVMEDIGQEQLGIVRYDYAEKKARAAAIINELRLLEGKVPRMVKA